MSDPSSLFILTINTHFCLFLYSGGPIAASWAVLHCMGQNGYMEVAKRLMEVAGIMKEGVNQVEVGKEDSLL